MRRWRHHCRGYDYRIAGLAVERYYFIENVVLSLLLRRSPTKNTDLLHYFTLLERLDALFRAQSPEGDSRGSQVRNRRLLAMLPPFAAAALRPPR